ncbi:MAG: hypothetical protein R3Y64_11075, partial [Peptostreptococcaceae bacterium]
GYSFEDGESYVSRVPTISQLNSVGANSSSSSSLNTNIQNNVDREIIYFTLNKTDLVPYYYQTSISITGETISYNTVVSIFKQIASGINGYVVEDKERVMFIGEGKPIIIKENKDGYLKEEVVDMFNSFKELGIKIESEVNTSQIKSLLEDNKLDIATINSSNYAFKDKPKLNGNHLQLKVSEVFNELGVSVEEKDNEIILSKDGLVVIFKLDASVLLIDEIEFALSSKTTKDGYADINLALSKFGYSMTLNDEKLIIK